MSKVLKIAGVSILVLGLVLGTVLPTLASTDLATPWADECESRMVRGKVLSVDKQNQEFKIQSGEQQPTISTDEYTKYFKLCVPGRIIALARHRIGLRHQNQEETKALGWHQMGLRHQNQTPQLDNVDMPEPKRPKLKRLRPFGEGAEFGDIEVGDRVVVQAVPLASGENSYLAKRVLIIEPTTYARVSGTITVPSEGKTITIEPADGNEPVTLDYNEGTIFILKGITQMEGQYAHAIYAIYDSVSGSVNGIAKRVVVHQLAQ